MMVCAFIETEKERLRVKKRLINLLQVHFEAIKTKKTEAHITKALERAWLYDSTAKFIGLYHENNLVGFCFFNIGFGISAGGPYVWLNDIFVQKAYRRKGGANALLKYLVQWVNAKQYGYIAAIADKNNVASQQLFKSNSFDIDQNIVWMDRGG